MLYIKLNTQGLKPLFASITKKEMQKIMSRTINYAVKKTKTEAVGIASRLLNLKQKEIRSKIFARTNLGTPEQPLGRVQMQYKSIGVDKFNPRETPAGLKVNIQKSGGTLLLKRAFLAKGNGRGGKSGDKKLAFVRLNALGSSTGAYVRKLPKNGPKRGTNGSELPIVRLYSKGLSEVMMPYGNKLQQIAGTEGQRELERQMDVLLGR